MYVKQPNIVQNVSEVTEKVKDLIYNNDDVYDSDIDESKTIRVANHYKEGVSGKADYNIYISDYNTMEELNKAIEDTISKAQKATENTQTLQSKKITPSNDVDTGIAEPSNDVDTGIAEPSNNVDTGIAEPSNNYHISKNLSDDLDNVLSNVSERTPVKLRDFTPDVLVQNGVKNLPMYENPSHIRKNILTDNEARELGLEISSKDHYHGLGKETYINAIDSLDDPRAIFKNKNTGNYLILTVVKDSNNNNIVVPIEIETTTKVNNLTVDINRVKSVYGYDRANPDLNKYIKDNIKDNNLEKIYKKKKPSTGKTLQSTSKYSIPSTDGTVNNQYMQNNENNSQGLENSSSFSLPKTDNQGRKLTKEQQEYFKDSFLYLKLYYFI